MNIEKFNLTRKIIFYIGLFLVILSVIFFLINIYTFSWVITVLILGMSMMLIAGILKIKDIIIKFSLIGLLFSVLFWIIVSGWLLAYPLICLEGSTDPICVAQNVSALIFGIIFTISFISLIMGAILHYMNKNKNDKADDSGIPQQ